jgi:LmbE family N-acetylglucosaminyl deacetylase
LPSTRQFLLRLARFALRLRSRRLVLDPGLLLVIAPHPDDETLGCGGLLLTRRRAGLPAAVLFLTDGAASHPGHPEHPPASIAALRKREAREAAAVLGLTPEALTFLDLPDGRLPHLDAPARDAAIARLATEFTRLRPATILVTHRHDGSSEHVAAFPLVTAALARVALRPRVLEYLVWSAHSPRLLARVALQPARIHRHPFSGLGPVKRRALASYRSQLVPLDPWTHPVLPPDFANAFSPESEFFLELPLTT